MSDTPTTPLPPGTFPSLVTPVPPAEVIARLERAARRGDLPGFLAGAGLPGFVLDELSVPFDHRLTATLTQTGPLTRIDFRLALLPRAPVVTAVVVLFSIWPGVWLMDSLLKTYAPRTELYTYWWYLPLAVLPVPWMWSRLVKRSRTMAWATGGELVGAIRRELGASEVSPG